MKISSRLRRPSSLVAACPPMSGVSATVPFPPVHQASTVTSTSVVLDEHGTFAPAGTYVQVRGTNGVSAANHVLGRARVLRGSWRIDGASGVPPRGRPV